MSRGRLFIPLLVGLLLWGVPLAAAAPEDPLSTALKRSRTELAGGQALKALEAARQGLEFDTGHLDLLAAASEAAEQADRKDEALWYARIAVQQALVAGASGPRTRAFQARVSALEPLPIALRTPLTDYAKALLEAGQYCAKRKLYGNAVNLLKCCETTPLAAAARTQLEKIYKNKKAVSAMLASGLDIPIRATPKRSARWIAKQDRKHRAWKDAYRIKSKNYTIVTNMGWELATAMSNAMEQTNVFYRRIFDHKVGGGSMARCTIQVYGSRALFEEQENETDPSTKGFYVPGENRVAAYDPRTEGDSLRSLWETLFHECTHQFIDTITTGTVPEWLNEGTATYFEGAVLEANGRVTEGINASRLQSVVEAIKKGQPSLKAVLSWKGSESYPGEYYPVGGAIVYFAKYYENENGEHVYAPIYRKFLDSYASGGKHDIFERFVEYFVTKARQPGIKSFKDFEERWRDWTLTLGDLYFGPPDRADRLIERARRQRTSMRLDDAVESYRFALRKRNEDPTALKELAETLGQAKRKDEAIASWRHLAKIARAQRDQTAPLVGLSEGSAAGLAQACSEEVGRLDPKLRGIVADAAATCAMAAAQSAEAYAAAKYPRNALYTLQAAIDVLQGEQVLEEARTRLAKASGVSIKRWRRLPVEDDLESWFGWGDWKESKGAIHGHADTPLRFLYTERLPARYAFEITIRPLKGKEEALFGIVFGVDERDILKIFSVDWGGSVAVDELADDWKAIKSLKPLDHDQLESYTLRVDVDGSHARFVVNGETRGAVHLPHTSLRGRVGLLLQDGEALFSNPRLAR